MSVAGGMLTSAMARHTTFRFCLNPTTEQREALTRHCGAARFAYNQCLRTVMTAMTARRVDPGVVVPRTGYDLINAFNRWKRSELAGRKWVVGNDGEAALAVTGLSWRTEVCQQVFEEAAVDCSRALTAWADSRAGRRRGRRVGFPRFKRKAEGRGSFRLRNTNREGRRWSIRVGDGGRPRSITVPRIGAIPIRDDTRRLRRMVAKNRARILSVTISERGGRWWASVCVEAAELHAQRRHPNGPLAEDDAWVGIDRGLAAFAVAASENGTEVARFEGAPKPLRAAMSRHRRLTRTLSRKRKGSRKHKEGLARLRRHHHHIANIRRHFLHQVSNALVKTHSRLVIEDLNVTGMLANHKLAQAISDVGWTEFARQLIYKQARHGGQLVLADRYFPSSRTCAKCGAVSAKLTLADRQFTCVCGFSIDRDLNAAVNLARWPKRRRNASRPPDPQAAGRVTNARRRTGVTQRTRGAGHAEPSEAGTVLHATPA